MAFAGQVALEAVDFFAEVGHVLERAVHGGETHVGHVVELAQLGHHELAYPARGQLAFGGHAQLVDHRAHRGLRSEEHTSELQSLMRISYAVFCLKKKKNIET